MTSNHYHASFTLGQMNLNLLEHCLHKQLGTRVLREQTFLFESAEVSDILDVMRRQSGITRCYSVEVLLISRSWYQRTQNNLSTQLA